MIPVLDFLHWKPREMQTHNFCRLCWRPSTTVGDYCNDHQRKGRSHGKDRQREAEFQAVLKAVVIAYKVIPDFAERFRNQTDEEVWDAFKRLTNEMRLQLLKEWPRDVPTNAMEQRIRRVAYEICEIKANHAELFRIATLMARGQSQSEIEHQLGLKPRSLSTKLKLRSRLKETSVCIDLITIPVGVSKRESLFLESNPSWRLWPFGYRPEAHYTNRLALVGSRYVAFGPRAPGLNLLDWREEANQSAKLDAKTTLESIEKFAAKKHSTKTSTSAP